MIVPATARRNAVMITLRAHTPLSCAAAKRRADDRPFVIRETPEPGSPKPRLRPCHGRWGKTPGSRWGILGAADPTLD
jgi:hypothetical protein